MQYLKKTKKSTLSVSKGFTTGKAEWLKTYLPPPLSKCGLKVANWFRYAIEISKRGSLQHSLFHFLELVFFMCHFHCSSSVRRQVRSRERKAAINWSHRSTPDSDEDPERPNSCVKCSPMRLCAIKLFGESCTCASVSPDTSMSIPSSSSHRLLAPPPCFILLRFFSASCRRCCCCWRRFCCCCCCCLRRRLSSSVSVAKRNISD